MYNEQLDLSYKFKESEQRDSKSAAKRIQYNCFYVESTEGRREESANEILGSTVEELAEKGIGKIKSTISEV